MLGSALKALVATQIPETLGTTLADTLYANAHRSLSVRAGYRTIKDISVTSGATTVAVPTDCVDEIFGVRDTDGSTYLRYIDDEGTRNYFQDNALSGFYVLGRVIYFTASLATGTIRVEYRSAFGVLADNVEISFPDYLVQLFTMLYVREYFRYLRVLCAMKREGIPDVKPVEIENFLKRLNEDIDRECSHLDID